jgi:hypothetical protein
MAWVRRDPTRRARLALAATTAAFAIATSACRVDLSVAIAADADGSGHVTAKAVLDGDAKNELAGDGREGTRGLQVTDLRKAGWTIAGPNELDGGGLEIVATHDFATPTEAEDLVADLAGDPGPFRNVHVVQRRTFAKTTTDVRATVDLTAGLAAFADPDVQAALGGTPEAPLGISTAAIEQRFGAPLDRLLGLQVAVDLPGKVASNAPTETGAGTAVWSPSLGDELVLDATSQRWNVANLAGAAIATASGLALLGLAVLRRRRDDDRDPEESA